MLEDWFQLTVATRRRVQRSCVISDAPVILETIQVNYPRSSGSEEDE